MIFKLSPILGSRQEVLETPFLEALHHLLMLFDKEDNEAEYDHSQRQFLYQALVHSQPLSEEASNEQKKLRENFINALFDNSNTRSGKKQAQEKKKAFRWKPETEAKMREKEAELKRLEAEGIQ